MSYRNPLLPYSAVQWFQLVLLCLSLPKADDRSANHNNQQRGAVRHAPLDGGILAKQCSFDILLVGSTLNTL